LVILGIDPGSHRTGFGLIESSGNRLRFLDGGTIVTKRTDELALRISTIHTSLLEVIDARQPEVMAIEGVFNARNPRSSLILGHARGAIMLAGSLRGLTIEEYAPRKVKMAVTGNGAAAKEQLRYMVTRLLNLPAEPSSLDTSDALAVAICCAMQSGGTKLAAGMEN
jgi:crossover junction endodeoxyribonuclease RuvC